MIPTWLRTLPGWLRREPAVVLMSIIRADGSTPREAGASMLVSERRAIDTIGGGHLEWQAMQYARDMLEEGQTMMLRRFALGASLGQCCGGVVWVLFERIEAATAEDWQARLDALFAGARLSRTACADMVASDWRLIAQRAQNDLARAVFEGEHWAFVQEIADEPFNVHLFGAGHVGEAIVRALAPIEANVTWIDSRDDMFPAHPPGRVNVVATDTPECEIDDAPAGCYFLVLTHSHALDLALSERILRRHDFAYFGLIGSRSKRMSFERKLTERGIAHERMADMTCPIGIPGIRGKAPAVIAAAVVAQLLQVREAREAVQGVAGITYGARFVEHRD
ncbi:MAG: xanthine dehydrogenase accessory protein XdhC [Rhodocyclaceae bacterium]